MVVYGSGLSPLGQPNHRSEELIERLFRRIGEVSSLPTVAVRIVEVINDPDTGAEDLLEVVRFDAALATRIVRTVNSSYYSMQNKVADLQLAIALLGFKEIRNLAMTAYIAQLFKKGHGHGSYSREGLWNHSIAVGAVAQLIAQTCGRVQPREAYLAGLLHDIGLILLDQYLHKPFCQVIDALEEGKPAWQVEQEILGFDHAELGAFVASHWSMPEHLSTTIRYHHAPQEYDGPHREMVYVVGLANSFCHAKGFTSLGVRNAQTPPAEVLAGLQLTESQLADIWNQIDEVLEAANILALVHAEEGSEK